MSTAAFAVLDRRLVPEVCSKEDPEIQDAFERLVKAGYCIVPNAMMDMLSATGNGTTRFITKLYYATLGSKQRQKNREAWTTFSDKQAGDMLGVSRNQVASITRRLEDRKIIASMSHRGKTYYRLFPGPHWDGMKPTDREKPAKADLHLVADAEAAESTDTEKIAPTTSKTALPIIPSTHARVVLPGETTLRPLSDVCPAASGDCALRQADGGKKANAFLPDSSASTSYRESMHSFVGIGKSEQRAKTSEALPGAQQASEIWANVKGFLYDRIPLEGWVSWIGPTGGVSLANGTLTISTESEAAESWIRDEYSDLIQTSLRHQMAGTAVKLKFVVVPPVPAVPTAQDPQSAADAFIDLFREVAGVTGAMPRNMTSRWNQLLSPPNVEQGKEKLLKRFRRGKSLRSWPGAERFLVEEVLLAPMQASGIPVGWIK